MDLNVAMKFSREIRHAVYRPRKFQAHLKTLERQAVSKEKDV
ncbi:hypothetical protein [Campylobacter curvus]|nr:hypothetical protein [Campylobacter curvus]